MSGGVSPSNRFESAVIARKAETSPPAGLEGRRSGLPCRIFGASRLQTGTTIRK